jgi:hypothetical protein
MTYSVKPRRQQKSVYTLRDFKRDEEHRQYLREVAKVEAKIEYWQKKVEKYGGEIHQETLLRFQARLAWLQAAKE